MSDATRRKTTSQEGRQGVFDSTKAYQKVFGDQHFPELLYHYTSFEGLIGILSGDSLRATFSECLNDSSERTYAQDVIEKHCEPGVPVTIELPMWPSPAPQPEAIFVTCFCTDGDLLSMWRSYTQQAGGFALGFSAAALPKLQPNGVMGASGPRLVRVHYGEEIPETMRTLLNTSEMRLTMEWIMQNMIKHPAFKAEQEWRLFVSDPPVEAMSFTSGHSSVKPSVNMKSPHGRKLPLKKLVYGPTLRGETTNFDPDFVAPLVRTLHWLLERYGYQGVEVVASNIPYRL